MAIEVPDCILATVRDAAASNIGDIEKAVRTATNAVKRLDEYDDAVDLLVNLAVQELVYRARASLNNTLAESVMRPAYVGPPKVNMATSAAVQRVAASVYNHAIGGSRLGDLTGEDLERLAQTESEIARGHQFNAALCRWCLDHGVRGDRRVREVISQTALEKAFKRLKTTQVRAAAAA